MRLRTTFIAAVLTTAFPSCVEDDDDSDGGGGEHDAEFADATVVEHDAGPENVPRAKTESGRATGAPRYPPRFEQNIPWPVASPSAHEPSRVRSTNSTETSSPSTAVMLEPAPPQ